MATGAVLDRRIHVPLVDEGGTNFVLSFAVRGLPIQIGHLAHGPYEFRRITVALETPRHRMRFCMVNLVHLIHFTVATHAADPAVHVHRMVEIHMLRRLVDLNPLHRLARLPGVAHGLELGILALNLRMAVHADLRCRDVRIRRGFDKGMAVATVHAELAGVNLVGEGNRLRGLIAHAHVRGIEVIPNPCADPSTQQQQAEDDFEREPVAPAWKDVRHATVVF